MWADGLAALYQSPVTRAQVAGPNSANFKRQPRTQILKYKTENLVIGGQRKFSSNLSAIFCPTHPPGRKHSRTIFRSRMGGPDNLRLDPRAWCLVLVVVPIPSTNWLVTRVWAKAHRVPRCAAQSLTAFPLLKQGYPRPTPFPVRFQLARLWASDSSSSFDTVRQRGCPTRSRLSAPPPKQSWLPLHLHYRWYFVKGAFRG